jgi:hypothetical protein
MPLRSVLIHLLLLDNGSIRRCRCNMSRINRSGIRNRECDCIATLARSDQEKLGTPLKGNAPTSVVFDNAETRAPLMSNCQRQQWRGRWKRQLYADVVPFAE